MPKTGINLFTTLAQNVRSSITKAATYTVLLTDELVNIDGTYTMTLPVISTMIGTTTSKKILFFKNINATGVGTVTAGTGNTIGGRSSITLQPGEVLIITATETDTDWRIDYPSPMPPGMRNNVTLLADTSGTTPVNVIDSTGCPVVGIVAAVEAWALDTNAGNIIVKNATDTICTIAKSTTAGLPVCGTTLTTPQMAVADKLTVESSTTNGNARVKIILSTQTLTKDG